MPTAKPANLTLPVSVKRHHVEPNMLYKVFLYVDIYGYLSEKVTYWLFKIFEIQKGRTFTFNDILRLCTIVVNIAIRIRA